jgi:predicted O-methyltransferase YrrM
MHLPWRDVAPGDGPLISTSVTPEETAALARLAAAAGDVLEIGSAFGYSAIVMALAGARVNAVDPHTWVPDSLAGMERNLALYGVADRVTILDEPSAPLLRSLELAFARVPAARFGMVFIDGDHSAAAVRADVAGALKILRPGGVLACHDYGEDCCCPGVRQALDEAFPAGPDELTGSLFVVKT